MVSYKRKTYVYPTKVERVTTYVHTYKMLLYSKVPGLSIINTSLEIDWYLVSCSSKTCLEIEATWERIVHTNEAIYTLHVRAQEMLRLYLRLCTILSRSIQKESISQYLLFFTSIMNRSRRHTYILPLEVSIYHWHSLVSHFGSSEILVHKRRFVFLPIAFMVLLPSWKRACKRVSHFAIRVSCMPVHFQLSLGGVQLQLYSWFYIFATWLFY